MGLFILIAGKKSLQLAEPGTEWRGAEFFLNKAISPRCRHCFYGQSEQLAYVRLPGLSAGLPGPPAKARLGRVQDQVPEHVLWEMPGLAAGAVKVGADERPLREPGVTDWAQPRGQWDATLGPSASDERAALIPLHCKGPGVTRRDRKSVV